MDTSKNVFNKKKLAISEVLAKIKEKVGIFIQKKPVRIGLVISFVVLVFLSGMYFQNYVISKAVALPTSYQIDEKIRQKSVLGTVKAVSSELLVLEVTGSATQYEIIVNSEVKILGGDREEGALSRLAGKKVMAFYLTTTDGRKVLKRVSVVR